jgi:hypothetical protein
MSHDQKGGRIQKWENSIEADTPTQIHTVTYAPTEISAVVVPPGAVTDDRAGPLLPALRQATQFSIRMRPMPRFLIEWENRPASISPGP